MSFFFHPGEARKYPRFFQGKALSSFSHLLPDTKLRRFSLSHKGFARRQTHLLLQRGVRCLPVFLAVQRAQTCLANGKPARAYFSLPAILQTIFFFLEGSSQPSPQAHWGVSTCSSSRQQPARYPSREPGAFRMCFSCQALSVFSAVLQWLVAGELFVPFHPPCPHTFSDGKYLGKSVVVKYLTYSMTFPSEQFMAESL